VLALTSSVAAFLLARLTAWPPHEDETLALFVGSRPLGELLDIVLEERGGAPLHFLLAAAASHSGGGLTALRLESAVFAVASIPLIAALAARLTDRTTALVATLAASASWIVLFHGIYGRMYSLFLFTSALSYLALLWATERDDLDGASRGSALANPRRAKTPKGGRFAAAHAWRFVLWGVAALACVASHPYGALVLASQGAYVLVVRRRVKEALVAFTSVGVIGTPFWLADLRLANRFDVGVTGGGRGRLGSPLPVLEYLTEVAGDFSSGWWILRIPILAVAVTGFVLLWRRRRASALLVACVVATPALAMLLARLGSSASPESRHLIFVLPFFATALAVAVVAATRRWGASVAIFGLLSLVVAQVGWAYEKTPQLFTGDPDARVEARKQAAAWLASTSRPDDIYFGYEPVYLEARRLNSEVADIVIPRADSKLAASRLQALPRPLGRGVWVFDAYDTNNCPCARRLRIETRYPYPSTKFDARAFGPYLVVRSLAPTGTPRDYLLDAAQVMIVGKSLFIGDADINFATVRRATDRLGLLGY
jgi:4-amino-4-deoxy-L-arabinose transferase-like glycosyltransferase